MSIAVAVSGGMDSLLSLALLKEECGNVHAVHAFFSPPDKTSMAVKQRLDVVCRKLSIPFICLDISEYFRQEVVSPFIEAYLKGLTPNPCALCNPRIKFGLLRDQVEALGFSHMATGHYARIDNDQNDPGLYRGADPAKDQSYFLSLVPSSRLNRIIFPLARMRKSEVAQALDQLGMSPPVRQESQEICFIPDNDYRSFLRDHTSRELPGRGEVIDLHGTRLGTHEGLWNYTLGQRRGLGIPFSEPLYVLDKGMSDNTLIVGTREQLMADTCIAGSLNLLAHPEQWPDELFVQTVYRQKAKPALVSVKKSMMTVTFKQPVPRPCPGQVAAVYSSEGRVLAGGIIAPSGPVRKK